MPIKNLPGKEFDCGKLIKKLCKKYILVECKYCKKEFKVSRTSVYIYKSCGCKRFKVNKEHHCWKGVGKLGADFVWLIKHRAKYRNIDWSIDINFLSELYEKQNGKYALSGLEIVLPHTADSPRTASLDRKDSKKGYTEDNVQWVHKDVNFMKQQLNQESFINLCHLISKNNMENK